MKRIKSNSSGPMIESLEDRAFFSVSPAGVGLTMSPTSGGSGGGTPTRLVVFSGTQGKPSIVAAVLKIIFG